MESRLTVEGTFLDFDRDRYTDKASGEQRETLVLVMQGDKPRYPLVVKVGKDSREAVRAALTPHVGKVVKLSVFAGRFGDLWLKEVLG